MAFRIRHCAGRGKKGCHGRCVVEESGFFPVHSWRIRNATLGDAGCAIGWMPNSSGRGRAKNAGPRTAEPPAKYRVELDRYTASAPVETRVLQYALPA